MKNKTKGDILSITFRIAINLAVIIVFGFVYFYGGFTCDNSIFLCEGTIIILLGIVCFWFANVWASEVDKDFEELFK